MIYLPPITAQNILRLVQLREPDMAPAPFEALFEQVLAQCRRRLRQLYLV